MAKIACPVGQTFNRWTVLADVPAPPKRGNQATWLCRCACGTERAVKAYTVTRGASKSCGCLLRERTVERFTIHGHAKKGARTQEFAIWCEIIKRCTNPNFKKWSDYGGRGITVCERWLDYSNFLADMGLRPSRLHSIDRRDNNKGYEPNNCYWATPIEQARNTRRNRYLTFNGETRCVAEWAQITGIGGPTIHFRLRQGWPVERALTTPGRSA